MGGRDRWQTDPSWQPLRRTIETLLATYDWGEALVALNVCVKPILDHLFMGQLATLAERQGDYVDAQLLRSFADDCAWQRAWTSRLLQLVTSRDSGSRVAVAAWIARWRPLVELAVVEVAANLGPNGKACGDQALKNGAAFMDAFVPEGRGAP
jgi:toluene monooxygenase system protein E